jgi:hypothetical protein
VIVTTSWDDGHVLDLRVAELLRTYGLAGTFYVAPENRELAAETRLTTSMLRELSADFEIGSHSLTHPVLTEVPRAVANAELVDSRAQIAELIGHEVTSFCYPRGAASRDLATMARAAGYTYARTTKAFDWSPTISNLWLAPTTLEAARPGLQRWGSWVRGSVACRSKFWAGLAWPTKAIELFDRARTSNGTFHIWGHSWVTDERDQWNDLEAVFRYIADTPGVTHLTNGQLADQLP